MATRKKVTRRSELTTADPKIERKVYYAEELAVMFDVGEDQLRRMVDDGTIPAPITTLRRRRWPVGPINKILGITAP